MTIYSNSSVACCECRENPADVEIGKVCTSFLCLTCLERAVGLVRAEQYVMAVKDAVRKEGVAT